MNKMKYSNLVLGALTISTVSNGLVANASNDYTLFKNDIDFKESSNDKYSINWEKVIGANQEDKFYDVIQSKDGGYIAVGQSSLTATTGFTSGDGIIAKFDSNGNELWRDILLGDETDRYYSVNELEDGSIIALGVSYSTDLGFENSNRNGNAVITKYSKTGTRTWVKNFRNNQHPITFKNAITLSDGNILVVCGKIEANIGGAAIEKDSLNTVSFMKISSSNGDVISEKKYDSTTNELVITDIKKSSDSKIILTGYSYNKANTTNSATLVTAKLNEDLSEIWHTKEDTFDITKGFSLAQGKEGEIYVVGEAEDKSLDGTDAFLAKFNNTTGDLEWMSMFMEDKDDSFNAIAVNSKGEVIAVGHSNSVNTSTNKKEVIMAKYGVDGKLSDAVSMGPDTQGLVVNAAFIDNKDKVTLAGKKGFNKDADPCDLVNPCVQYDAMLLSVDEKLDSPVYCTSTVPTLVAKDITITKGQKINPLDYVSIKEENLSSLAKDITFTTNLEGSGKEYFSNTTGEFYIEYVLVNDCGDSTAFKIKVVVTEDSCSVNLPNIVAEDSYTYYIGDTFNIFSLIKVSNIDTTKIKETKSEVINGKNTTTVIYESGDKVVASSDVDYNKEGTYTVNFKAYNSCGEGSKDSKIIVKNKTTDSTTGSDSTNGTTTEKPQTGDNILVYGGLALAAVGGLVAVNKKSSKKDDVIKEDESK